jgi:hypothetical protein
MRTAALLMTLLALGCSDPAPRLRYGGTGLHSSRYPFTFALRLINDGNAPATINNVGFQVSYSTLLRDDKDTGALPAGFSARVVLMDDKADAEGRLIQLEPGAEIVIEPGETLAVTGILYWQVRPDTPMLPIVRGRFVPMLDDKVLLETPERLVVLENRDGEFEAVCESETTTPEVANRIFEALRSIAGEPSDRFNDLLDALASIAERHE